MENKDFFSDFKFLNKSTAALTSKGTAVMGLWGYLEKEFPIFNKHFGRIVSGEFDSKIEKSFRNNFNRSSNAKEYISSMKKLINPLIDLYFDNKFNFYCLSLYYNFRYIIRYVKTEIFIGAMKSVKWGYHYNIISALIMKIKQAINYKTNKKIFKIIHIRKRRLIKCLSCNYKGYISLVKIPEMQYVSSGMGQNEKCSKCGSKSINRL